MAQYNADIRIGVTGKTQLNQLEAQLKRTQTQLNKLNKSLKLRARVQSIKLDTRAANTSIKQLEQRINRLGRTITVNLRTNERAGRRSGGQSGGAGLNTASLASVGAASTGVQRQKAALERVAKAELETQKKLVMETEAYGTEVSKVVKQFGELETVQAQLNKASATYADKTEKIADLTRQRNAALGQAKGLQTRLTKGQIKNADAVKRAKLQMAQYKALASDLNSQIGNANKGYGNTNKLLERKIALQKQVFESEKKLSELVDKTARKQIRRQKFRKGAAAGGGVAAASAAGNLPIVGDAVTGGLVASFSGGSVAAGAFAGALVGLTSALVGYAAEAAKVRAQFDKLNISLKLAAGEDYARSLKVIRRAVDDFNAPLVDTTEQFTKLFAAAQGSGISFEELEDLFIGLSAANKAYAGSTEDLNGILRAFTQIISKGTVQSEELKGQVGERLPGAFKKAADALGLTTAQLQKALENGEVSSADFVRKFGKYMLQFEDDAAIIADAPAEAGARLAKAMQDLQVVVGTELATLGAAFQDFATNAINALIDVFKWLEKVGDQLEGRQRNVAGYAENIARATEASGKQLSILIDPNATKEQKKWAQSVLEINQDVINSNQKLLDDLKLGPPVPSPTVKTTVEDTTKTKKGKGSGSKSGPQDRTAELRIELELQRQLNALQDQTIIGNARQVENNQRELEVKRLLLAADAEKQRILLENTTGESKRLATMLVEKQLVNDLNALTIERAQTEFDRNEALQTTLRGLQEQIDIEGALTDEAKLRVEWAARIAELDADGTKTLKEKAILEGKINELYGQRITLLNPIVQYQRELEKSLADTDSMVVSLAQTVESELATAMSSAITGLVDGTKTAEEAFADMFANIGKAFIDMATQMIAKALVMKALGILTGGSGGQMGGSGYFDSMTGLGTAGPNFGLAEGGYVTGPTNALIGEGGEPEYVIPESKMGSAMQRYASGASGGSVLDGSPGGGGGGTAVAEAPTSINISGGVMQFGGDDYIRKDQLPGIIEQAGAQGETRALRRLRNSPSTRRKIGL